MTRDDGKILCDGRCRRRHPSRSLRLRSGALLCPACSLEVDRAGTLGDVARVAVAPPSGRAVNFAPGLLERPSRDTIVRSSRVPKRWYDDKA